MNKRILDNVGSMLPSYMAIYEYLESEDCSLEQSKKDLCLQIVSIQIFVNYFYSVYIVSLSGALKTTNSREQQVHLKYVNAYIIEGYKALWGYSKKSQSMWGKFLKCYNLVKDTDKFDLDIETITSSLKQYAECALTDKDERDLAMHYQIDKGDNPKVLLKLEDITIEKELDRYEQFGVIFRMMGACITEMLNHYLVQNCNAALSILWPTLQPLSLFDQNIWANYLAEMNDAIIQQSRVFDECKEQILKSSELQKKSNADDKLDISECCEILSASEVMLAVAYMSLDLCSTLKLYFNSENSLEQAIALSRINIICYSIIDRVYGYISRSDSYWKRYLTKSCWDNDLPKDLLEIKEVMEKCIETGLYSTTKRLTFVHLKKENFISAIKMIYAQDPMQEIRNSIAIATVLLKIQQAINS